MYLSQPLCISECGGGYDDPLAPALSIEVLQVLLQRLQPGQLLEEVDGGDGSVGRVPVQLLLQGAVDLIQGTQEQLQRHRWQTVSNIYKKRCNRKNIYDSGIIIIIIIIIIQIIIKCVLAG